MPTPKSKRSPAKKKDNVPDSPSPIRPSTASKRKARVVSASNDSDIEVIEPKKKKTSGSAESDVFGVPAASILAKLDTMFGKNTSEDPPSPSLSTLGVTTPGKISVKGKSEGPGKSNTKDAVTGKDSPRPELQDPVTSRLRSRPKVMTEKARVLEDLRLSRVSKASLPPVTLAEAILQSDDKESVDAGGPVDDGTSSDRSSIGPVKLESDCQSPNPQDNRASSVSSEANGAARDDLPVSLADTAPEEGDDLAVMAERFQDPLLRRIYKNLPHLARFRDFQPFLNSAGGDHSRVSFSTLCNVLSEESINLVLSGLLFVKAGCFVNTSRIHPNLLSVDKSGSAPRLKIAGTNQNAVGIMLGVVTECFLIKDSVAGPLSMSFALHKVTIVPFAQEMRRDTSMWGLLFDFDVVTGSVSGLGISFNTRRESNTVSAPSSPKKNSGLFMSVASPSKAMSHATAGASYLPSLGFEDKVPIYDARRRSGQPFAFTNSDFETLSSLPLYRKGMKDLPDDAVVAVGYTLNTYSAKQSMSVSLSTNVQFVILLAVPATSL